MIKKIFYSISAFLFVFAAFSLYLFFSSVFQADIMLAQVNVNKVLEVDGKNCYEISLDIYPDNNEELHEQAITDKEVCGDIIGLGYEFTLPAKIFIFMQKPGITITNVVAFEKNEKMMTANIPVGRYEINIMENIREKVALLLSKTPLVKSFTYDTKSLMKTPKEGAVISYKLEPFRQQVFVECEGCKWL